MIGEQYILKEVNGTAASEVLIYLNSKEPRLFPPLEPRHLDAGFWWLVRTWKKEIIGFAGLVPFVPFERVGYLKRAYIAPAHRGHGLQLKLLKVREAKAVEIGWTMLASECAQNNAASQNNFIKAGYIRVEPEQCWGARDSVYFVKQL